MGKNFIYRHEEESSPHGKSVEDFYINSKNPFSSGALLGLQFFLESCWDEFRGVKQAGEMCAFIGYIHSGVQKRVTEDGEYIIRKGDLVLERQSRKVLYTTALPGEILRRTGVILYRNSFFDLLAGTLFPDPCGVIHCSDPEKMENCFRTIKEEILEHDGRSEVISQLLFALLQEGAAQNRKKVLPEKFSRILDYIEEKGYRQISREELASCGGVSVRLLTGLFRKYLHTSPGKYLSSRRMEYAGELLVSRRLTVGEVARLAGFSSTEFFIKEFRRCKGTTPGRYMKMPETTVKEKP